MQSRFEQGGMFEIPARRERGSFFDIGGFASIIVGAVAAVAVLYFFPPTITIEGGDITTTQYDLVQLIALSLIVGSTGGVILQSAQQQVQQRLHAAVSDQKLQTAQSVGQTQVGQVGSVVEDATEKVKETLTTVAEQHNLDNTVVEPLKDALEQFQVRVQDQVQAAQKTLSASTTEASAK
jgi:hypothetical protein